jgi:hypothetical protein
MKYKYIETIQDITIKYNYTRNRRLQMSINDKDIHTETDSWIHLNVKLTHITI